MANLNNIVTVNVSTLTSAVKQAGFGTLLIADYHTKWSERVRTYTDLAGMVTDGFATYDAAYRAAAAAFGQTPQPESVKIGRRLGAPDLQIDLTPVAVNSKAYSFNVIGPTGATGTASYTADSSATVAEITAGLKTAFDALSISGLAAATDGTTYLRIKASTAGKWFSCTPTDFNIMTATQTHADPSTSIATDLADFVTADPDWYAFTVTTQGCATNSATTSELGIASKFAEDNKKILFQTVTNGDVIGSGSSDVASNLYTATRTRTALLWANDNSEFAGAAFAGATLPLNPGSLTFKFKHLAGVSASGLTATQIGYLQTKDCNFYDNFGGVNITADGKVSSGEYIDIIRDRDWFESRLQARVYQVLVNNLKVPYTDAGISLIEAELRAQLTEAIDAGFLTNSPAPIVVVPKASAVSSVDKGLRKLTGISFTAHVAGAVHLAVLTGTITL